MGLTSVCVCLCDRFLTVLIQEELVESQAAGLFADEAVHILGAVVVYGDGIFQRFNTRLQTERNLGVADSVPETETDITVHKGSALKGEINCCWFGIITTSQGQFNI